MCKKENILDLVKTRTYLPTTIDELQKYIIIGKERLKARQAEIRAYDKTDCAETEKKAVLANARNVANILLDAESKLGELLADIPPVIESSGRGTIEKKKSLPSTITKKQSHYAQTVSSNPEIVEQVKVKAKEKGTLPTTAEVVKEVKKEKRAAAIQKQKLDIEEGKIILPAGKYEIIVIDPPWKYGSRHDSEGFRGTTNYPEMGISELKKGELLYKTEGRLIPLSKFKNTVLFNQKQSLGYLR